MELNAKRTKKEERQTERVKNLFYLPRVTVAVLATEYENVI